MRAGLLFILIAATACASERSGFPGLTADLLALTNRALPDAEGGSSIGVKGKYLRPKTPAWLNAFNESPAARNNQFDPHEAAVADRAAVATGG